MAVRLHIERLVVDAGMGVTAADTRALEGAITAELGRLLGAAEAAWSPGNTPLVRMTAAAPTSPGAETFGMGIAQALGEGIRP